MLWLSKISAIGQTISYVPPHFSWSNVNIILPLLSKIWDPQNNSGEKKPDQLNLYKGVHCASEKNVTAAALLWRMHYYSHIVCSCTRWKQGHNLESSNGVTGTWGRKLPSPGLSMDWGKSWELAHVVN